LGRRRRRRRSSRQSEIDNRQSAICLSCLPRGNSRGACEGQSLNLSMGNDVICRLSETRSVPFRATPLRRRCRRIRYSLVLFILRRGRREAVPKGNSESLDCLYQMSRGKACLPRRSCRRSRDPKGGNVPLGREGFTSHEPRVPGLCLQPPGYSLKPACRWNPRRGVAYLDAEVLSWSPRTGALPCL
jgi:hypothetical protein